MDEGSSGVEKVALIWRMEAVVKPLVTRTSDGVEDDRYLCQEVRGGRPCYGGGRLWYGGGRLWYRGERPAV